MYVFNVFRVCVVVCRQCGTVYGVCVYVFMGVCGCA